MQLPPEAASLEGFRVVLDKWDIGPQISGRVLVASSNPGELAQKIQQTMPQFALQNITTDGKPVAFDLPKQLTAMLGNGSQGWIAANNKALVAGVGTGEDAQLGTALAAPAGDGSTLMRMHMDGKMYDVLGSWMQRMVAVLPSASQANLQQSMAVMTALSKIVKSINGTVSLTADGVQLNTSMTHR